MALAAVAALSILFYLQGISIGFLRTYASYHFLRRFRGNWVGCGNAHHTMVVLAMAPTDR